MRSTIVPGNETFLRSTEPGAGPVVGQNRERHSRQMPIVWQVVTGEHTKSGEPVALRCCKAQTITPIADRGAPGFVDRVGLIHW